jgi:DNA-binding transcriptional ArsR family regulator
MTIAAPAGRTTPDDDSLTGAMDAQAEAAAELLKAMANPQRLRVLCLLAEGERSVGEINAAVALSQSALSQHLALLREQGLVSTRREAQSIFYSLVDGPVARLIHALHDIYCPAPASRARRPAAASSAPLRKPRGG